jgi:uncharacterized protein YbjQ (UPF0145 family)
MSTQPALSELGVTEFLAMARAGFYPRGLVVGSCVFSAGSQYNWTVATEEITSLSEAMRQARKIAIDRMRKQARALNADGVVDVRLEVEHHLWRGARQVAKCVAVGTAISFEPDRAPAHLRDAPSLHLQSGPFDSDLGGSDFVTLLASGYRPITVAMGNCVYGLDPRLLRQYRGNDTEIAEYTQAFRDARETAMERLQHDLFREYPKGALDTPCGIVGMTVSESVYGGSGSFGPPIVEFQALGTAIAPLYDSDPRREVAPPKPRLVVPLDR